METINFGLSIIYVVMGFNCIECGICCTTIDQMLEYEGTLGGGWDELIAEFPYFAMGDGSCSQLNKSDMSCKSYADRPRGCSVDKTRDYIAPEMPIEKWYAKQEESCNIMQRLNGWSEEKIKREYEEYARRKAEPAKTVSSSSDQ
jgi:Fe-S-cluster containining protein